jgi:hypothetical protein
MKYETPELTALMPAINAVQSGGGSKSTSQPYSDSSPTNEQFQGYVDWE